MAIKTSDLNAKLFGKTDKRRATTPVEAQKAAKSQTHLIELAVAGEDVVTFELKKVAAKDIETKTVVFSENAREQSFLTEHALFDILSTLREKGQQYPAVGRLMDDGKIEVLDGSRRRMSCVFAKQDFLIYVAEGISTKHAKFLSDVANAHKPLSLYERGKEMQLMLAKGDVADQKELAKVCQCSEALVSGALKAATLPLELLNAYPSVSDIGRPTVVKLHKLYHQLSEKEQKKLLEQCSNEKGALWMNSTAFGISRMTKEITELIEVWVEDLLPKSKSDKATATDLVKNRASYKRKGSALTLNLKKIDDALMEDILDYIRKKVS